MPAPTAYLEGLRELCTRHGMLLLYDEVQSGFGRTGKMWAHEHSGTTPDVLISAKGIASGMPLSLISSRAELTRHVPPGSMGGTYAGNAVACAAALATLDVFESEGLVANAAARGAQLTDGLKALAARHPTLIADVRGQGLMVAMELRQTARDGLANALSVQCKERGMLLLTTSVFEVCRFIPPLTVTVRTRCTRPQRHSQRALLRGTLMAPFKGRTTSLSTLVAHWWLTGGSLVAHVHMHVHMHMHMHMPVHVHMHMHAAHACCTYARRSVCVRICCIRQSHVCVDLSCAQADEIEEALTIVAAAMDDVAGG